MGKDYKDQTADEIIQRLKNKEDFEIVDVREPEEWESGHIPSAKHIPLGELVQRVDEMNKSKETVIVCHSGMRSEMACDYLSQFGYKVVNMSGGMMNWPGEIKQGN